MAPRRLPIKEGEDSRQPGLRGLFWFHWEYSLDQGKFLSAFVCSQIHNPQAADPSHPGDSKSISSGFPVWWSCSPPPAPCTELVILHSPPSSEPLLKARRRPYQERNPLGCVLGKHDGSAKSGCQEWFCHSSRAQTLHLGLSWHVWWEFPLMGDARLLTMETTVLNLSRGQAQHWCCQFSDVPL